MIALALASAVGAAAFQTATTAEGRKVRLDEDGTWKYLDAPKPEPEPRYIEDALRIWDVELTHQVDAFGNKDIRLLLHFENKCSRLVQSVTTAVKIRDKSGKILLSDEFEQRLDLAPHKKAVNEEPHIFKEGDVEGMYRRLLPAVLGKTAKIETRLVEGYLDDETLLESKDAEADDEDEDEE